MKEYTIKFKIFGHGFCDTIKADAKHQALEALKKKIALRTEIDDIQEISDHSFDSVKDLFRKSGLKI